MARETQMQEQTKLAAGGSEVFPEGVVLQRSGGVLNLAIDRPDNMNRLLPEVLQRLALIAEALREDNETQVLVISGAGDEYFSMGIMNPEIRAGYTKDQIIRLVRLANRTFDAIEALPQIVIAAINGKVLAGGVELCLACDIRYAAGHATMCMPEAQWGGFPGAGAPVRLPQIVGRARALELICTAREIDSTAMQEYGLVQDVQPAASLREYVAAIAEKIAGNGPLATRGAKRIVNMRLAAGFQPARELADSLRHALEWSHDVDEGHASHRDNRRPKFLGR
jgi:enoyl-CoA hydratase/carnithine racemase